MMDYFGLNTSLVYRWGNLRLEVFSRGPPALCVLQELMVQRPGFLLKPATRGTAQAAAPCPRLLSDPSGFPSHRAGPSRHDGAQAATPRKRPPPPARPVRPHRLWPPGSSRPPRPPQVRAPGRGGAGAGAEGGWAGIGAERWVFPGRAAPFPPHELAGRIVPFPAALWTRLPAVGGG